MFVTIMTWKANAIIWILTASSCVFMLLAGCTALSTHNVEISTTAFNLAVEKTQNEMLLLNIVRASKRHPMYFTNFNLLRGNMTYNVQTGSLTIPFGKIGTGLNGAYSIAPSMSYSTNPSFDLGVLDNKEFIRGMLNPVDCHSFKFFWSQGWPPDILLYLFVEKIEVRENTAGVTKNIVIKNDPGAKDFQRKIDDIISECTLTHKKKKSIDLEINNVTVSLEGLVKVQEAGFLVTGKTGTTIQITKQAQDYFLDCKKDGNYYFVDGGLPDDNEDKAGYLYLRSPEAILYYLGEIVRAEITKQCPGLSNTSFFVVENSLKKGRTASVSVEYEGLTYMITRDTDERIDTCRHDSSMQVLSLVSLLISKQKSQELVPTTGAVNVLGR